MVITQDHHPFKVIKATSNIWVGGQPGVKGYNINITIDNPEVKLETVYFRNMKSDFKVDNSVNPKVFVGVFTLPNTKNDYTAHQNSDEEYGNKAPKVDLQIPFELKENEAVVSYMKAGKISYYKIDNVVMVKSDVKY